MCNAFKTRAEQIEKAVKAAGKTCVIDHAKAEGRNPDRGSFVVVAAGKTIVELRGMARPFPKMKELDMAEVAKKVLAAL